MDTKFTDLNLQWLHKPKQFTIEPTKIEIITEPNTDYWQKTYYGFQNDKAPIIYAEISENFTFEVKTVYKFNKLYDHCGIILYQDS